MKILLLVDHPELPVSGFFSQIPMTDVWKSEREIYEALKNFYLPVREGRESTKVESLIHKITSYKPQFIFNLCESFDGNRQLEAQVAALLELLEIPFSGCRSSILSLCKNKQVLKTLISANGVKTPKSVLLYNRSDSVSKLEYPLFVKPNCSDSSDGISANSLCFNQKQLDQKIQSLFSENNSEILVEEFVEGIEVWVGALALKRSRYLFAPQEVCFEKASRPERVFFSQTLKWNNGLRKKLGYKIKRVSQKVLVEKIRSEAEKALMALPEPLYGMYRIDFRYDVDQDELFLLEINPNPSLEKDEAFMKSVLDFGWSYEKFLKKILLESSSFTKKSDLFELTF